MRRTFLGNPLTTSLALLLSLLLIYNYYPFNASPPYSETLLISDPMAIKLYLFSISMYFLLSVVFMFLIPLSYLGWRIPGMGLPRRYWAAILVLGLIGFIIVNIALIPAWLAHSRELLLATQGIVFPMFAALIIYSFLIEDALHAPLLMLLSIKGVYGDVLQGIKANGTWRLAAYLAALFLIDVLGYPLVGVLVNLPLLEKCGVCIYPYFREWNPRTLRIVTATLATERDVSFASLFTWGDVVAKIACGILEGLLITRYVKRGLAETQQAQIMTTSKLGNGSE